MRRFLSPRWLALHLLMVAAFGVCLFMAWWQLTRAQGGNALSWGYTFEWPVFGVFAVVFWIRLIRDERRRVAAESRPDEQPEQERITQPVLPGAPRVIRRTERRVPAAPVEDDPELAAYNAYLAWQNANPHRSRRDYPG